LSGKPLLAIGLTIQRQNKKRNTVETIFQSIEILSKEKGIDPQIVLDAVKDAMLIAARKHFRTTEDYIAELHEKTGALQLFAVKKAVEVVEDPAKEMTMAEARRINPEAEIGAEIRIPKKTDLLGRISAQTAKQVIFQKVREAERETVFNEYSGRTGELVNCTVKRVEGPDYILDLGKTEARLPKKEQSRLDARRSGVGDAPVRAGSSGDLRQHRDHQGLRAGSRRTHQDRRAEPRSRRG
jgi:transcription termination/antitermination protein NusA